MWTAEHQNYLVVTNQDLKYRWRDGAKTNYKKGVLIWEVIKMNQFKFINIMFFEKKLINVFKKILNMNLLVPLKLYHHACTLCK